MQKTKILLTHRFFYPDSPTYAYILEDMRKMLLLAGYHVEVLSTQPSYKESDRQKKTTLIEKTKDGSIIYRIPMFTIFSKQINKILNYFWFPLAAFIFQLFSKRYDIVTVATTPPVLYAFAVALVCKLRNRKLIYHVMDIHPEIGKLSGEFKNKYIYNILTWMDNFTCKTASSIIVLSMDMKNTLVNRNHTFEKKIKIINNYDISTNELQKPEAYFKNNSKIKVVFAGNIGRFQNLESFIQALQQYGTLQNFELIFVGEGSALNHLKKISKTMHETIKFIPHQSITVARQIISEADMAIVSLETEIIKYAYPSKTMTYLAEGTPILVCVDDSELSHFIAKNKIGVTVTPSDLYKIHQIFTDLSAGNLNFDKKYIKRV